MRVLCENQVILSGNRNRAFDFYFLPDIPIIGKQFYPTFLLGNTIYPKQGAVVAPKINSLSHNISLHSFLPYISYYFYLIFHIIIFYYYFYPICDIIFLDAMQLCNAIVQYNCACELINCEVIGNLQIIYPICILFNPICHIIFLDAVLLCNAILQLCMRVRYWKFANYFQLFLSY